MRLRFPIALVLCALACVSANAASIALRPNAIWTERAAAGDLQRVIYAATGKLLPVGPMRSGDREVIAVGFSPVKSVDLSAKTLGDQGFVLKTMTNGGKTVLVAAGANAVATSYAVYTLAERYGAGFYLGGDALPSKRTAFAIPKLDVIEKPALKVRGVLPWYNFFDSPTTWNIEDYRSFIDQLAKSKNNFLGFHSYDYEPFCAYRDANGKMIAGAPLVSTAQSTWGTVPMTTADFAPCARGYFESPYFGADCSMGYATPEQGVANAKKLLAEALWYAKARGVKTCVGFEVSGDPTAPGELDRLEQRLRNLLKSYPMLDYVWIWEPEAMGLNGIDPRAARTDFGAYYRRWASAFAYVEDPRRRTEAVRVGIYALAAHRILKREAPGVKMILSAWGGDNHLRFTDFYPGYDKVLPKDIIFSALDNIITSDTVSAGYGKLSKDREFWPIPWFEYDGDQWCPQPNTKRFYNATRDALAKGASGMLGIHWRTRDVEESHAYMSQFAWDPKLGYEEFYKEYARKAYGDERAAGLLMGLQDLGYRWIGGAGQVECGGFSWNAAPDDGVARMNGVFDKYADVVPSERLGDLGDMREWLESNDSASRLLRPEGRLRTLLNSLRAESREATGDEKKLIASDLAEARRDLSAAIAAASRRTANRGELGILATINTKAWASLLAIEKQADESAGVRAEAEVGANGGLAVSSILRLETAFVGESMRISAVAHGASSEAKAEVRYRPAGSKEFRSTPLSFVAQGRLEGRMPTAKTGLIEYYIRVADGGREAVWPLGAPKNLACVSAVPVAPSTQPGLGRASIRPKKTGLLSTGGVGVRARLSIPRATCEQGPLLVTLSWPGLPDSRAFRVTRSVDGADWAVVATARDNWFEDRDVKVGSAYSYRIVDADSGGVLAETDKVRIDPPPLPSAPDVTAVAGPGRVRLSWRAKDLDGSEYRVYRANAQSGPFEAVAGTRRQFDDARGARVCDCPAEPGKECWYVVRGVAIDGREGPMSTPVAATAVEVDRKPVLKLDFDGTDPAGPKNCVVEGGVACMRVGSGAFVELPHKDAYNPDGEITIEFWVKLREAGQMPVFVSHGAWNQDGYFVQYYAGKIRLCLDGVGTLDAGRIELNKWTHVVVTYDGAEMTLYLNGDKVASQPAAGLVRPSNRPLYVGRYDYPSKEYEVDGWIGRTRIYRYAISPDEVTAHYREIAANLSGAP